MARKRVTVLFADVTGSTRMGKRLDPEVLRRILLGDATYRVARAGLRVEAVAPVDAKGKSEAVVAWRLVGVLDDAPAFTQRIDAPFVGLREEPARLVAAFRRSLNAAGVFDSIPVDEALAATQRYKMLAEGPLERAAVENTEGLLRGMRGELAERTRRELAELRG